MLFLGAFGVAAPVFLLVLGQSRSDAVTVAIVSTTMPLISALMSWLLDGAAAPAGGRGHCLAIVGGSLAGSRRGGQPAGPQRRRAAGPGVDDLVDLVLARGDGPSAGP